MFVHDQLLHHRRNAEAGYSDRDHLLAAANWLARAQDATGNGGVSGRYGMSQGWSSSYPETSGYVIPTFLALAADVDPSFRARARRCVDFLLPLQLPEGAFPGGELHENRSKPSIFNTAQILNGLTSWHAETGDRVVAEAAARAADWLVAQLDDDGAWRKHIYLSITTYTAHASCWLAEAGQHFGNETWLRGAERHLDWVLSNVDAESGWINLAGFKDEDHAARRAVTHTLAYTIWGVLFLSQTLGRADGLAVARRAADGVLRRLEISGWLPGVIDHRWRAARTDYACLTGNVQMALIWFWLAEIDDDPRFINGALKAIDLVKAAQPMTNGDLGIRGGISGSAPIWGDYIYMAIPNWAAKFFIDALYTKRRMLHALETTSGRAEPWAIPSDVPRSLPSAKASGSTASAVVLLSSPGSQKVPQMIAAYRSWGFRPTAVILEEGRGAALSKRLARRIKEDGIVRVARHSVRLRKRSPETASRSTPNVPDVASVCQSEGIPVVRVTSLSSAEGVAAVTRLAPDLLVHAGAGILRRDILAVPRLGTLNAHMGILPRFRGMNVGEWSAFEGSDVGCTVHLVDEGIDTGDILVVEAVDAGQARSVSELRDLIDRSQIGLLGRVLRFVMEGGSLPPRRRQTAAEGRQYFRMHGELKAALERRLARARPATATQRAHT